MWILISSQCLFVHKNNEPFTQESNWLKLTEILAFIQTSESFYLPNKTKFFWSRYSISKKRPEKGKIWKWDKYFNKSFDKNRRIFESKDETRVNFLTTLTVNMIRLGKNINELTRITKLEFCIRVKLNI